VYGVRPLDCSPAGILQRADWSTTKPGCPSVPFPRPARGRLSRCSLRTSGRRQNRPMAHADLWVLLAPVLSTVQLWRLCTFSTPPPTLARRRRRGNRVVGMARFRAVRPLARLCRRRAQPFPLRQGEGGKNCCPGTSLSPRPQVNSECTAALGHTTCTGGST